MITGLIIFWAAVLTGLLMWRWQATAKRAGITDARDGWIYFAGGHSGPIKIGMTSREPTQERLPELKTMSPTPLRIMYKFHADDRYAAERQIHDELAPYRQHGEWFDRDVALFYIDHLKGAT